MCGIVKTKKSGAPVPEVQERVRVTIERDTSRQDLMQEMMKIMIPMVTPYIAGYIQKYIGEIPSAERE